MGEAEDKGDVEGEAQGLETTMTDDGLVFSSAPDFLRAGDHIRFLRASVACYPDPNSRPNLSPHSFFLPVFPESQANGKSRD